MTINLEKELSKFSIDSEDLKVIHEAGNLILPLLPSLIEKYRLWLINTAEISSLFDGSHSLADNLALKLKHWQSVWQGKIDDDYLQFRWDLGALHAKLGISLEQYFGIVTTFSNLFEKEIQRLEIGEYKLANAFSKLVHLDVSIVLRAYALQHDRILREQTQAIVLSISIPVAQLWDGILLVPLVGIIDSSRAQSLMTTMLQKVADTQARVFILDISGVSVVDTAVVNHFIKITKATRLMGCQTIISGISPAVAQTIVELGVYVDEIKTTASMQDALKAGLKLCNIQNIN